MITATRTRQQLIKAIENGIQADDSLTKAEIAALRLVAASTPSVGMNFNNDCPLVQAGLYSATTNGGCTRLRFVAAYDYTIGNPPFGSNRSQTTLLIEG